MTNSGPKIPINYDKGSFRDRSSRVVIRDDNVYRLLDGDALDEWLHISDLDFYKKNVSASRIIDSDLLQSAVITDDKHWKAVLEHPSIPMISYPYEWCFSMLKDAAILQLELLQNALEEGATMKDASAYNIQWIGATPTFIDVASFIRYQEGSAWIGYKQFCELFLFPLMIQAYKDIPYQPWLRGSLEGISASDISNLMSYKDRFRPGVFLHAYLQATLQSKHEGDQSDVSQSLKNAGFSKRMVLNNIHGMRNLINKLTWKKKKSVWSNYVNQHNYNDSDYDEKKKIIDNVCNARSYRHVWDMGCNTGTFSRIASKHADYVTALDFDELAIDNFYNSLKREGINNILTLTYNIADPSPGLGWRNEERGDLPSRGKPDLILALALLHHLVIGANIPMDEVIDWFDSLGGDIVIEFVDRNDSMTKRLLANKDDVYHDYDRSNLESLLEEHYTKVDRTELNSGNRTIYHARR